MFLLAVAQEKPVVLMKVSSARVLMVPGSFVVWSACDALWFQPGSSVRTSAIQPDVSY